jgi:WD40 repeat protein
MCEVASCAVLCSALVCHCIAGVTSLDFSQRNPHILGVGMQDGTIAVYDVRSRQDTPVLVSTADTGKHADPVWKVCGSEPGIGSACACSEERALSLTADFA